MSGKSIKSVMQKTEVKFLLRGLACGIAGKVAAFNTSIPYWHQFM